MVMKRRYCSHCGELMAPDASYTKIEVHDHWSVEERLMGARAKHKEQRKVLTAVICPRCADEVIAKVRDAV